MPKTARQLKLTQPEFDALIKVRDLLRAEVIHHDKHDAEITFDREVDDTGRDVPLFNMATAAATYECGSVACIGGNMSLIMQGVRLTSERIGLTFEQANIADSYVFSHRPSTIGLPSSNSRKRHRGLTALFYPRELGTMSEDNVDTVSDWERITPAAAVDAIDNFLETGDPKWEDVGRKHGIPLNEVYLDLKRKHEARTRA